MYPDVSFASNTTIKQGRSREAQRGSVINEALVGRDESGQRSDGTGNSAPERPSRLPAALLVGWLHFTFVYCLPPFSKSQRLCYPQVAALMCPPPHLSSSLATALCLSPSLHKVRWILVGLELGRGPSFFFFLVKNEERSQGEARCGVSWYSWW